MAQWLATHTTPGTMSGSSSPEGATAPGRSAGTQGT